MSASLLPTPSLADDIGMDAFAAKQIAHSPRSAPLILSPPPSPFARDAVLFATSSKPTTPPPLSSSSSSSTNLFPPLVDVVRQRQQIAAKRRSNNSSPSAAALLQPVVFDHYARDPHAWLRTQRKLLHLYKSQYAAAVSSPAALSSIDAGKVRSRAGGVPARVTKVRSGKHSSSSHPPSSPARSSRPHSRHFSGVVAEFVHNHSKSAAAGSSSPLSASASKSTSSPSSSPSSSALSTVHDIDYDNLPDFCPSISTLDGSKAMRTDWKGNAMDLSDDPDRELLHPAELQLASILRLPCMMYLDSKKRIFAERVFRARKGLQFRRTDSQKACRIDVNKATRLFVAFERVGWFDQKFLDPYLN
ncbi:hypothetical protein V1514DRAFT_333045 [Lipomyces japonicus]|uniref:uncharacterized protein n=1 Tax=Lipomyces japonicus TaxID=56871 RepID=UPI0034CF81BE